MVRFAREEAHVPIGSQNARPNTKEEKTEADFSGELVEARNGKDQKVFLDVSTLVFKRVSVGPSVGFSVVWSVCQSVML